MHHCVCGSSRLKACGRGSEDPQESWPEGPGSGPCWTQTVLPPDPSPRPHSGESLHAAAGAGAGREEVESGELVVPCSPAAPGLETPDVVVPPMSSAGEPGGSTKPGDRRHGAEAGGLRFQV